MNPSLFYLALFGAGGSGVLSRYLLTQLTVKSGWTQLPFGTLFANASGSFLIGFLSLWLVAKMNWDAQAQIVVLSGFLGGFTTFSAFSLETIRMVETNQMERAVVYVLLSVVLSLAFCLVGLLVARRFI